MKTCTIIALIILLWQASVAAEYAGINVFRYGGLQAEGVALNEPIKNIAGPNVGFDFRGGLTGSSKESGLAVNTISSNLNSIINSRSYLDSFGFDMPKMMEFKDSIGILILSSETGEFVSEDTSNLDIPVEVPDPAKEVNAMFNLILLVDETIPADTTATTNAVENAIHVNNAIAFDDTISNGNTVPVEEGVEDPLSNDIELTSLADEQ
ncbi:MAG: hypothetical protein EHM14_04620 [Methanothrix sp.]|nr:MAG: hypothetical protein EHM14_04620 [Methanothrix sp.]